MHVWFWEKLELQGSELPTSREGHSFQYNSHDQEFVLFGGVSSGRSSESLSFDSSTGLWKKLSKSKPPLERAYHVSWIEPLKNRLFIFGGQGTKREPMYDMHSLCIRTGRWTKLGPLEKPSGRIYSAGCVLRDYLYLFGGSTHPSYMVTNDFWAYPYGEVDWKAAEKENHLPSWIQIDTYNTPESRRGHTMLPYLNTIYIFGGFNGKICLNDVNCISPPDNNFIVPHIFGQSPCPRAYHSAAITENSKMIVFGGKSSNNELLCDVFILDLIDLYWSSPFIGGFYPSPRHGAGISYGKNKKNFNQILIIGGIGNGYVGMDVFNLVEKVIDSNTEWHLEDLQSGKSKLQTSTQSTLLTNKKKIRDLEGQNYLIQEKSGFLDDEIFTLNGRIEEKDSEKAEMHQIYNDIKKKLTKSIKSCKKTSTTYKNQISLKNQKISTLSQRFDILSGVLKEAESLLVTLDSYFYEIISCNLQDEFKNFSQERMEEISERKKSHSFGLMQLQSFLIQSFESESLLSQKSD